MAGNTMTNPFIRDLNEYRRDYDFEKTATDDLAFYLSRARGISIEEAKVFLKKNTQNGMRFARRDPEVMYLQRESNGDRVKKTANLSEYIKHLTDNGYILSPSLTGYTPRERKVSIWAHYIQHNLKLRKKDKGLMFTYKMRGDLLLHAYYKTMQESRKIKNNSLSGLQASPSTVGYNLTAHSALTSLCRCATSYANAANERFIGGLRHYYAPTVVDNHLITASRFCDINKIRMVHERFNLKYPTADDVVKCIYRSSKYYWESKYQLDRFRDFASKMLPEERAAFMFTGDMYHLDQINPTFVKQFLLDLSEDVRGSCPDANEVISGLNDNFKAIASLLNTELIAGIKLEDAEKERPEAYQAVALTALNMQKQLDKYQDVIDVFFKPRYLPHSIAYFPNSKRESVPTSDTDSTIFTCQYWADKYGDTPFSKMSWRFPYAMIFMISGMIENTLLLYSANLGVSRDLIHELEMKNEFIIPAYVLTNLAKHYFSYTSAQEGNVYASMELDRKGVNLRSSNAPQAINDGCISFMEMILDRVIQGKLLNKQEVLAYVQDFEAGIEKDLKERGFKYLNSIQIKNHDSYTDAEDATAYQSYLFWNRVFAKKYGAAPTPPYRAIKVSVKLPNKTAIRKWIASIKDPEFRALMQEEIGAKNEVNLFRLPKPNIKHTGIPIEIHDIIDTRSIIREVMKPFYLILESLGIYITNKESTRIVLDERDPFFNEEELEEKCNAA